MTFAQWVRDTREGKRLTKAECARRAGISHVAWIEYENEEKTAQPRRETVRKIAQALDVPFRAALLAAGYDPNAIAEFEENGKPLVPFDPVALAEYLREIREKHWHEERRIEELLLEKIREEATPREEKPPIEESC